LLPAFDGAGPANQNHVFICAHPHSANVDRGGSAGFAGREFVRLEHRHDRFHSGHGGERLFAKERFGTYHADDHARRAAADLRVESEFAHSRNDPIDLFVSGVRLRDNDHNSTSGIMRMPPPRIFCKPGCWSSDLQRKLLAAP
jgi:hypothetical protein